MKANFLNEFKTIRILVFLAFCSAILLSFCSGQEVKAISNTVVSFKHVKDISLGRVSNGSTINGKYYIYTDGTFDDKTNIYRCSWPSFSNCKLIFKKVDVGHANIVDAKWGSKYFWVLDLSNYTKKGHHWCFDSEEKKSVKDSKCGSLPPELDNRKSVGSTKTQDLTQYGDYILKGYASPNKIEVRKNNKTIALLKPDKGNELEGVFVDATTGTIYFTVISKKKNSDKAHWLHIYKITDYKLPVLADASNNSSSGGNGGSGGSGSNNGGSGNNDDSNSNTVEDEDPEVQLDPAQEKQCATILSFWCDETDGERTIRDIIRFIVNTMTIGIAVLATIGIIWCGALILSARDNEQQIAKAKKRLLEIIIGVVIWALAAALLNLFLPSNETENLEIAKTTTIISKQ